MNYFGSIFAMVVCIAMSAYFSATETAFSSLNKTPPQGVGGQRKQAGSAGAQAVRRL